jgi:dipeptide/tripeptide permease
LIGAGAVSRLLSAVQALAITFWVGALWSAGFLVAPLLFRAIDDRTLAGNVAGRIFEATAFTGLICGLLVLVIMISRRRADILRQRSFWLVIAMLCLVLIGQFVLQPVMGALRAQAYPQEVMRSALGNTFALWHAAAQIIYLVQCLLGAALVISMIAQHAYAQPASRFGVRVLFGAIWRTPFASVPSRACPAQGGR